MDPLPATHTIQPQTNAFGSNNGFYFIFILWGAKGIPKGLERPLSKDKTQGARCHWSLSGGPSALPSAPRGRATLHREPSDLVRFLHPGRVLDLSLLVLPVHAGRVCASPCPGRSLPGGVTERDAGGAWRGGAALSGLTTCEPVVAPPGACSPKGRSPSWRLCPGDGRGR